MSLGKQSCGHQLRFIGAVLGIGLAATLGPAAQLVRVVEAPADGSPQRHIKIALLFSANLAQKNLEAEKQNRRTTTGPSQKQQKPSENIQSQPIGSDVEVPHTQRITRLGFGDIEALPAFDSSGGAQVPERFAAIEKYPSMEPSSPIPNSTGWPRFILTPQAAPRGPPLV